MGTVQVLTKDRMLAIEAGTIVSGEVDSFGNLILTRHDGSTYNAGLVYPIDATDSIKGLVELATASETLALSDDTIVITPNGLASVVDAILQASASKEDLIVAGFISESGFTSGTNSRPIFTCPFDLRVKSFSLIHWGSGDIALDDTNWWLTRLRKTPNTTITPIPIATKTTRITPGTEPAGEIWYSAREWSYSTALFSLSDCARGDTLSVVFSAQGAPSAINGPIIGTIGYEPL